MKYIHDNSQYSTTINKPRDIRGTKVYKIAQASRNLQYNKEDIHVKRFL